MKLPVSNRFLIIRSLRKQIVQKSYSPFMSQLGNIVIFQIIGPRWVRNGIICFRLLPSRLPLLGRSSFRLITINLTIPSDVRTNIMGSNISINLCRRCITINISRSLGTCSYSFRASYCAFQFRGHSRVEWIWRWLHSTISPLIHITLI